jgi:hypothetical protein
MNLMSFNCPCLNIFNPSPDTQKCERTTNPKTTKISGSLTYSDACCYITRSFVLSNSFQTDLQEAFSN